MELGDLITRYRKESGLTIDELAERSGVPKGTLTKIIGNTTKAPSLETVRSIARALGKTLNDFDDAPAATVDPLQAALLSDFAKLNREGQGKLADYAVDLVASGRYVKATMLPTAARGGGIIPIPADAADAATQGFVASDDKSL